jgi:hypothetical protein
MAEKAIPPPVVDAQSDPEAKEEGGQEAWSTDQEKRLLRKVDLHVMVPLWVLFMFGFLERINLGNVAVLGIVKELHLVGDELNVALLVFFVPYVLFGKQSFQARKGGDAGECWICS